MQAEWTPLSKINFNLKNGSPENNKEKLINPGGNRYLLKGKSLSVKFSTIYFTFLFYNSVIVSI